MKKLVLYSDQVIPENAKVDQRLLTLLGKPAPTIGYIPSCADPSRKFYDNQKAYYAAIGIELTTYFELDKNFEPDKLPDLLKCDGIHLTGGNTFHFLYWLRARGMLDVLRKYVEGGGVLIGASAGSILMTPEIGSSVYYHDEALEGEEMDDLSALNLAPFAFFPHLNVREEYKTNMVHYSIEHTIPVYGCADGDGIVVDGDKVEFIGGVLKAENGNLTRIKH
jgi:dipeptidase E